MSSLLPPGVPEHRDARRLLELQWLQSWQEAALQADCLGQIGKLQASFSKDKEEVFNHCWVVHSLYKHGQETGTAHSRVPGFCDAHRAREDYILQVLCQRHRVAVSMLGRFSHIRLFAIPWIVARQVLLSMGFSRQEHWGGLPCSPPGDLPDPGIEPVSLTSPALAGEFFTTSATKGPLVHISI